MYAFKTRWIGSERKGMVVLIFEIKQPGRKAYRFSNVGILVSRFTHIFLLKQMTGQLNYIDRRDYCLKARCICSSRKKPNIKIGYVNYSTTCLVWVELKTSKTQSLLDNPISSLNPRGSAWSTCSATPHPKVAEFVDQALLRGIQLMIGLSSRDLVL